MVCLNYKSTSWSHSYRQFSREIISNNITTSIGLYSHMHITSRASECISINIYVAIMPLVCPATNKPKIDGYITLSIAVKTSVIEIVTLDAAYYYLLTNYTIYGVPLIPHRWYLGEELGKLGFFFVVRGRVTEHGKWLIVYHIHRQLVAACALTHGA